MRRVGMRVELDEVSAKERVERRYQWVAKNDSRGTDTYGVTTGFGATSYRKTDNAADLQKELICFLNAGIMGKEHLCLPAEYTKGAMLVRTNNIAPKLPLRGTITALGDLVPLSYIVGLLTARPKSKAFSPDGHLLDAMEALRKADFGNWLGWLE